MLAYGEFQVASSGPLPSVEEQYSGNVLTQCIYRLNYAVTLAGNQDDPEKAIRTFLQEALRLFHAQHIYLFELSPEGNFDCSFLAKKDTIEAEPPQLQQLSTRIVPEFLDAFYAGRGYMVRDMKAYHEKNPIAAELLSRSGVSRMVTGPLLISGRLAGTLVLDGPEDDYLEVSMQLIGLSINFLGSQLRLRNRNRMLGRQSRHDPITGVYNIAGFQQAFTQFFKELREGRHPGKWATLFVNIRKFKTFNRERGYAAGDHLLKRLAAALTEACESDLITRLVSDHFMAVVADDKAETALRRVARQIQQRSFGMVSIGAGIYTMTGEESSGSIALDRAKVAADTTRGDFEHWYCRFNPEMEKQLTLETYLISHVDEAINKGWIKVYYQPIISTLTGKISMYEALCRWDDPVYGFLSPAVFIETLEKAQLLYKVDLYVLAKVCYDNVSAQESGRPAYRVSVNFSRNDLDLPNLHAKINAIMAKYHAPHECLHIELTETALTGNVEKVQHHIDLFHRDGFEVWLDDFGSGYSSLNTLQNFNFDCIKIDMLFLRKQNERTAMVIKSIVNMAKNLNMLTLTEGVETKEQYDFLESIGCSFAQGYYFSKPDTRAHLEANKVLKKLGFESQAEHIFCRQVSRVSVLDSLNPVGKENTSHELPTAILKSTQEEKTFLYLNGKFRDFLAQMMPDPWQERQPIDDGRCRPFYERLMQLAEQARTNDGLVYYDFVTHDMFGRISVEMITEYQGQQAFYIRTLSLEAYRDSERGLVDSVHKLYEMYDNIVELDTGADRIHHIYGMTFDVEQVESMPMRQAHELLAGKYLQPAELLTYLDFVDTQKIDARLAATPRHTLNAFFHVLEKDGSYIWKRFVLTEVAGGLHGKCYLLTISRNVAGWTPVRLQAHAVRQDFPTDILDLLPDDNYIRSNLIWKAFSHQQKVGIFWKDRERRFAGANPAFLRYYGLTLRDILGKTDEDMGWHPDPEPFKRDEERVLREGITTTEAIGECVVKGEVRKIMASKTPIRSKGKIVGLVGYFVDITNAAVISQSYDQQAERDKLTGCLNGQGFQRALQQAEGGYQEGAWHDFGLIRYQLRNLKRIRDVFGADSYAQLLRQVAAALQEAAPAGTKVARVQGGLFELLVFVRESRELVALRDKLSKRLLGIHAIDPATPITIYFAVGSALYSETRDLSELHTAAGRRMMEAYTDKVVFAGAFIRSYNRQQIEAYMAQLRKVFDSVRLVSPAETCCLNCNDAGGLEKSGTACYAAWKKGTRCVNCASARAISENERQTKIEFSDDKAYFVLTEPVEVNGTICAMECIVETNDLRTSVFGRNLVQSQLNTVNDKIYSDSLTGIYNRRYYDEIAKSLFCTGIAFLDVNHFKKFNDTYGHEAGDVVLREVAQTIKRNIRNTGCVIRYGGDEFLVFFQKLQNQLAFLKRLQYIQQKIESIQLPRLPKEKIGVSIGAVFDFNRVEKMLYDADQHMYKAKKLPEHISVQIGVKHKK